MANEATNTNADTQEPQEKEARTFTQDEVNELVGKTRKQVREKYADYEELKAKAQKFDETAQASKTELERALERAQKAESALEAAKTQQEHQRLVLQIAKQAGVPADLLHGKTEEELTENAQSLKSWYESKTPNYPTDKGAGTTASMTKDDIMDIKNTKERLLAIARNRSMFE